MVLDRLDVKRGLEAVDRSMPADAMRPRMRASRCGLAVAGFKSGEDLNCQLEAARIAGTRTPSEAASNYQLSGFSCCGVAGAADTGCAAGACGAGAAVTCRSLPVHLVVLVLKALRVLPPASSLVTATLAGIE